MIGVVRVTGVAFVVPLMPSLLWWVKTQSALHFRGWVNVEYVLLLCVTLIFPSWWMIGILIIELAVSLIEPVAHLYYFSPYDAIRSMQYVRFLSADRVALYIFLAFVYLLSCAKILRMVVGTVRHPDARQMVVRLVVLVTVLSGFDMAHGRRINHLKPHSLFGDMDVGHVRLAYLPIASVAGGMSSGFVNSAVTTLKPLPSAMARSLIAFHSENKPDIVLVLVESWGLAKDERLNIAELGGYAGEEISDRYEIQRGTVPFAGATTSGETRELCGDSHGRSDMMLPAHYYEGCWPARLKDQGYRTLAVHGFTPTMFSRREWYQSFGFEESAFLPELSHDGTNTCSGAFPGACDGDVARWIAARLLKRRDQQPMFVHWVTLNSHLPVAATDDTGVIRECVSLGIDREKGLCSWFGRIQTVHQSIVNLAIQAESRPTVLVIVGDHAPPFLNAESRDRFSQDSVPYLLLVPRMAVIDRRSVAQVGGKVYRLAASERP